MATLNAPTLQDTQYSGDAPLAAVHGEFTFAATPANDVIRLARLYAGTKIVDLKLINAALGASTQVSLGFQYVNGEAGGGAAALLAATATSTAGTTRAPGTPVTLAFDAFLTATLTGGSATGKIDVLGLYKFEGK
jgi:hypothetical protein